MFENRPVKRQIATPPIDGEGQNLQCVQDLPLALMWVSAALLYAFLEQVVSNNRTALFR
jgi:hypothetical protein